MLNSAQQEKMKNIKIEKLNNKKISISIKEDE